MSNATLIVRDRYDHPEGGFVEVVVWLLPKPVAPSTHLYKYRLVYIMDGERVVGYDNERGKGDHYHVGNEQFSYIFTGLDALFADFEMTLARWNRGHRHL